MSSLKLAENNSYNINPIKRGTPPYRRIHYGVAKIA